MIQGTDTQTQNKDNDGYALTMVTAHTHTHIQNKVIGKTCRQGVWNHTSFLHAFCLCLGTDNTRLSEISMGFCEFML